MNENNQFLLIWFLFFNAREFFTYLGPENKLSNCNNTYMFFLMKSLPCKNKDHINLFVFKMCDISINASYLAKVAVNNLILM